MAADRFEDVIGDAHLGKLGDDGMPQVVEPQAVKACRVALAEARKRLGAEP